MGRAAPRSGIDAPWRASVKQPSDGAPSMGRPIWNLSSVTLDGLDLAKNAFQAHAIDAQGSVAAVTL